MEKINYLNQYGGNNLTEKPLEYYLEAFEKTDPYKITSLAETPRHEFFFCGICSIPLYISRMGSLSPTGNFHPGNCTMTFFAEGASNGCSGSIRGGSRISRQQRSSWEEF